MERYIIFEDNDILILNKPFGMLVQQDKKATEQSLYCIANQYIKSSTKNSKISLQNRLDRGVGGLVLFGKNDKINKILTQKMQKKEIHKYYLAVACGEAKNQDILTDWLMKNQRLNISKVVNKNNLGSKEAKLSYKKLKQIELDGDIFSLLEIELLTGRHHQIRVQLSNKNLPLYNDTKYNKIYKSQKGNIGLFAYKLQFFHPFTNKNINIEIQPNEEIPFSLFC